MAFGIGRSRTKDGDAVLGAVSHSHPRDRISVKIENYSFDSLRKLGLLDDYEFADSTRRGSETDIR